MLGNSSAALYPNFLNVYATYIQSSALGASGKEWNESTQDFPTLPKVLLLTITP